MNEYTAEVKTFHYQKSLSEEARLRYSRHLLLPGFSEKAQLKLINSRIAVVGAGGLGSPILQYLAAAGIGHFTIIDHDKVDISNLQRQVIHSENSLGEFKAVSAAKVVNAINSNCSVQVVNEVLNTENALAILSGHDLVLDGTDNFPTRYLVSDACEILDLPLVWGSILGFDGQVSVFYGDSGKGATYRDLHQSPPLPGEVPSCAEAGVFGMLVGIIGSAMALEALKVLTGIGTPLYNKVAFFDALNHSWEEIPFQRAAQRKPVTELEDLALTCGFEPVRNLSGLKDLTFSQALKALANGATLIDIRELDEVAAGKIPEAIHIPQAELRAEVDKDKAFLAKFGTEIILHCQSGGRSKRLQAELWQQGIEVSNLLGGYQAASKPK